MFVNPCGKMSSGFEFFVLTFRKHPETDCGYSCIRNMSCKFKSVPSFLKCLISHSNIFFKIKFSSSVMRASFTAGLENQSVKRANRDPQARPSLKVLGDTILLTKHCL